MYLRTFSELTSYLGIDPTSQRQKTFLKVQIRRCTSRHFSCFSAAHTLSVGPSQKHVQFGDIFFFSVFFRNVTFLFWIGGNSITTWTRWGGKGRGSKKSVFVHAQSIKTVHAEGGGQKWQNSVHVVVECPLMIFEKLKNVPSSESSVAPIHVRKCSIYRHDFLYFWTAFW